MRPEKHTPPMPSLFLGHGTPMNAILNNRYTDAWQRLGREIPKPKAILAISAHWLTAGTGVTVSTAPKTIHDFGGFPQELFAVQYPAPGDPQLAHRVQHLLAPVDVTLDESWGLDHGTWSVLKHVYPRADIPVVQLSMDAARPAAFHFDIGKKLAPLREEGVLILGSGNVVHNLRAYVWGVEAEPHDWAARFEATTRDLLLAGEFQPLIDYDQRGKDAALSIPTPEHYLPLLYVLGTRQPGEIIRLPIDGVVGGSLSMLAAKIG